MVTSKETKTLMKLFSQISSPYGDGAVACQMLHNRLEKTGMSTAGLARIAKLNPREYGYVSSNADTLRDRFTEWCRVESTKKAQEPEINNQEPEYQEPEQEPEFNEQEPEDTQEPKEQEPEDRYNPDKDPGEGWQWVRGHTRTLKNGKIQNIRGHWRMAPRAQTKDRHNPDIDHGPDYIWIDPHTRWCVTKGRGRYIEVRGYWKVRSRRDYQKAA